MSRKKRVLILCSGNSCRSQMAEGFWRHFGAPAWDVFSAGLEPKGVHPLAVRAMREIGIEIGAQTSDSLDEYIDEAFDLVVTVCGNADARCPSLPNVANKEHWPFDDPAGAVGDDERRMALFRRVRDAIGERIRARLD